MSFPLKGYKKDQEWSYTLGAFPTMELLKAVPEYADSVYIHSSFRDEAGVSDLCSSLGVPVLEGDRGMARVSPKENVYVLGVFRKYISRLEDEKIHLVLVNPGDMGNLGTIIRTAVGFGIKDIAVIEPAADRFSPKTVRASMGAIFRTRIAGFPDIQSYMDTFPKHKLYTFMLDGAKPLYEVKPASPAALVFGNEATGLPSIFAQLGESVYIPQTDEVDSLNLTIAAGIGMYIFTHMR